MSLTLESKLFKGFADESRLSILDTLLSGPKTVSDIVDKTSLSQPNVSAHLSCLFDCSLVKKTKKGREVYYRLSCKEIGSIIEGVRKIVKKRGNTIQACKNY
jgi:DNA-binding transcriptional ArsR family regulator